MIWFDLLQYRITVIWTLKKVLHLYAVTHYIAQITLFLIFLLASKSCAVYYYTVRSESHCAPAILKQF